VLNVVVSEVVSAELVSQSAAYARPKSRSAAVLANLGRMRFQLAGGLIAAVIIPAILRLSEMSLALHIRYDNTLIGTFWAFCLGYLIFRKVTAYPGVRATAFILPAFLSAYALTIAGFFMLRLDYSGFQFALSFALATAFFYLVFLIVRRVQRMELAIVPVGDYASVQQLRFVDWRVLTAPVQGDDGAPIVVDLRADLSPEWERFIADSLLAGRPVYNAKQVFESLSGRVQMEHLSENTFGSLTPNSIYGSAKRYCDFLLAILVVVALAPLLALIALAIRLDSPGPSIFRQARMGFRGKEFTVYKFRTMSVADPAAEVRDDQMTRAGDVRITRLGRFLRKTRIDELPQVLNILKGEMSWIGPRPEALKLSAWYEGQIPFYRYRHIVRPGITGWAQVSQGHVTSLSDADLKLQFDFFYVKNFSLWLDILVLLKTVRVVLTGSGSR